MEYFKITRRCIRCRKPLRDDGTCQNEKCVRYTSEEETTSNDDTKGTSDTNNTEKK